MMLERELDPVTGLLARVIGLEAVGKIEAADYEHAKAWKRTALVSDLGWVAHLFAVFGWMGPGNFKQFGLAERDAATAWVALPE